MLSTCRVAATLPFRGLAAAERFYRRKIGLQLRSGSVADGYLEFAAGGGTVLQLFESKSRKSKDTAATFEVDDLAREMAALRRRGVEFEEYDLPGIHTVNGVATMEDGPMAGHKAAWFEDPAGHVIALHQEPKAGPTRPETPRGRGRRAVPERRAPRLPRARRAGGARRRR